MNTEIEATFTDVDPELVRAKLKELRAEQIYPERLMRRQILDFPDLRLDKQAAWIRVRDQGDKITVTFKQRQTETIEGMKEAEVEVNDFDQAVQIFFSLGLTTKALQETKRELWFYNGCHVMIDHWPWIPPFIEIEGTTEELVIKAASDLGFTWSKALFDSTDAIYQQYFEVGRTEISTTPLTFGPIPDWLEAKRRS